MDKLLRNKKLLQWGVLFTPPAFSIIIMLAYHHQISSVSHSDDAFIWIIGAIGLLIAGVGSYGLIFIYTKKQKELERVREHKKALEFQSDVFDAIQDSIIIHDYNGDFLYLNKHGWETRGYTHSEMITLTLNDLNSRKTRETATKKIKEALDEMRQKGSVLIELEHQCKDGTLIPVEMFSKPFIIDGEEYILSNFRDISERKKSQREIEFLSKAIEQVDDIVYITDKAGNITYVNDAYCRDTGYKKEEVVGKNARLSKSGKHDRDFYKELWDTILSGKAYRNTMINRKKDGSFYYEKKTVSPLLDSDNKIVGFISTGKDVTEEELFHQEIERIATIDKLTGIYNRHKFEELFALESERARRFGQPLSLIVIDIDHFKSVNDNHGHDVGDDVLKGLALIVQMNIRKIDVFARWGGEEFLMICPNTDKDNVLELAEKLRKEVERAKFPVVQHITISMGISVFEPDDSFSTLFKRADQGLYYAKEHGRNQSKLIG